MGFNHILVAVDFSPDSEAGVERVMGFCTDEEYRVFMETCPDFELMLQKEGIILIKYWFSVSDEEQERRFQARTQDPVKRWKLSPMDLKPRERWVEYSEAKDALFEATDLLESPWYVVNADSKKKARLNCINHLLTKIPYKDQTPKSLKLKPRPH